MVVLWFGYAVVVTFVVGLCCGGSCGVSIHVVSCKVFTDSLGCSGSLGCKGSLGCSGSLNYNYKCFRINVGCVLRLW